VTAYCVSVMLLRQKPIKDHLFGARDGEPLRRRVLGWGEKGVKKGVLLCIPGREGGWRCDIKKLVGFYLGFRYRDWEHKKDEV
jgi:hypothetical protein